MLQIPYFLRGILDGQGPCLKLGVYADLFADTEVSGVNFRQGISGVGDRAGTCSLSQFLSRLLSFG